MHSLRLRQWVLQLSATLAVLTAPGGADVWQQNAWRDTVYYRATFRADRAGEAVLHVAAVDRYVVYLNGVEVGADSLWTRMAAYPVQLRRFGNELGIRVVNEGRGAGTGLLVYLDGDSLQVATTTNPADQVWKWSAQSQQNTDWTTATVSGGQAWRVVQDGSLDKGRIVGLVDTSLAAVAGLRGGIDVGSGQGRLALGPIDGVNLALNRPSNQPEVSDGDLGTSWDPPTSALNHFAAINLQSRRHIHRVRVLTRGTSAAQLEENALRGYSVQISDDNITWSEVGELRDITQYAWTDFDFKPVTARHVRVVVTQLDPATSPKVAEVQVFGTGYPEEGFYVSPVIHPGAAPGGKNLGRVEWDVSIPEPTGLALQFRGGNSLDDFADPEAGWSAPLEVQREWYPAAEPAEWIQYRLHLISGDGRTSPALMGLRLEYETETAVSVAQGWVTPTGVPMGMDTTFTYHLALQSRTEDSGIARLTLSVPAQARLDESAQVASLLASWHSSEHLLTLVFAEPLRDLQELIVPMRTRTFSSLFEFRASLFGPDSDNPLNAGERQGVDPTTGVAYGWSVRATTSPARSLMQVRPSPPVLTPNGDGINDGTVIGFVLAKLDVPQEIDIRIYDLSGRLVRQLPVRDLAAGEYSLPGPGAPGYWDGRDGAGNRVPPGLYLYRVRADLDTGVEVSSGGISVAY